MQAAAVLYENVFPRVCFSTRPFGTTPLAPVTAVPLAAAAAGACACRVCGYETTALRCTLARARARDAPAQWARRLDCRNCWFSADHGLHADLCTLEIYQRSSTGNKQRTTLRFTARHLCCSIGWLCCCVANLTLHPIAGSHSQTNVAEPRTDCFGPLWAALKETRGCDLSGDHSSRQ